MSDWRGVSTDDLITLQQAFERRLAHDDGMVTIELNSVHWSRCFGIMYEIAHELTERQDREEGSP